MLPLLLATWTGVAAAASYDPSLRWQTLETEHFRITFHDDEESLAREMAVDAEVAYTKLAPEIGTFPRRKIEVVLVDWTDSANGYATVVPVNAIVIYVTAPDGDSTLGLYRDWNEAIITHELAHILHIDTVEGLPRAVRAVMGRYISVHQLSPAWIVEGYATYQETRHTVAGRGRSATVDMIKRTAVLEGRFPPLGNLDGFQSEPPSGNLRYLFGQDFMQFIADQAGPEAWTDWIHRYGRGIPYLLPARRTFGSSFVQLYRAWKATLVDRYQRQAAEVAAQGLTPVRTLSPEGESCGRARWSPDGTELAFNCYNLRRGYRARAVNPTTGAERELFADRPADDLAWRADGKAIFYAQTRVVDLYSAYEDVYVYDLEKKRSRAVTDGARAREPAISPDGTRILVVTNQLQNERLQVLTADGRLTPLTDDTDHTQFDDPAWSPDGRWIAVSVWKDGSRDLWVYTADGRPWRRLTWDAALDREPAWSADGNWLYFTSDRSGIPNLYAVDLRDEHVWQVTNVVTGAYGVDPHPDGTRLALQIFSTAGSEVAVLEVDRTRWLDRGYLPRWAGVDGALTPGTLPPVPESEAEAAWPVDSAEVWGATEPTAAGEGAAPDGWEAVDPWGAAPEPPPAAAPAEFDPWGVARPAPAPTTAEDPWGTQATAAGDPWAVGPPPSPGEPPTRVTAVPALAQRIDVPVRPYDPLPTLLPPRYWVPGLYLTSTGESLGLFAVAATGGRDLLGHYGYSAYLTWRSDANFVGGGGSLVINRWRPVLGATVSTSVTPYGDIYRQTGDPDGGAWIPSVESTLTRYWDHRVRGALSGYYPLSPRSGVTAFWSGTGRGSLDPIPADAYLPYLPTRGFFSTVGGGWSYGKADSYALSISPEEGRSVGLGVELTPSWLGSFTWDETNQRAPFTQLQATAEWREYRTAPWLANHVFGLKLAGGASLGDRFNYGSFRLGGTFSEYGITVVPSEWRMLRGFYPASDSGEWYWLASGEYRFPVWWIDRGWGTLPVFLKHLSGAVLVDTGNAFDDLAEAGPSRALVGTGAELRTYLVYGYGVGLYARFGYAFSLRGGGIPFGDPGGLYMALGSSF